MSLRERLSFSPELRETSTWAKPSEEKLTGTEKEAYQKRKKAIELYMEGKSFETILEKTGLPKSEVYRFLGRCLEVRPTGEIFGFFGIVPKLVQKPYTRTAPLQGGTIGTLDGLSGAFTQLVSIHPELHDYIVSSATRMRRLDAHQIAKSIHKKFLERCAEFRRDHEYPFNTKAKGLRALERFIGRFLEDYWLTRNQIDDWTPRTGQPRAVGLLRPYEECENDGHLGDMHFVFRQRGVNNEWIYTTPMKCFIILNVDRGGRAILGYSYELGSTNYPSICVARSVTSTLTPWKPRELTVPGLEYLPGAGLPYGAVDGMPPLLIDALFVDNARANRAKIVMRALAQRMGAVINHGRAGEPIARAIIERVNKTLEECGFRKLPVGFNPNGPRESRERALRECEKYAVTVEEFEQILDVVIANYNASLHSSLSGRSPNQLLESWLASPGLLLREAIDPAAMVQAMLRMEFIKTIRAGRTRARSPYVQIWGARYSNEAMRKLRDWKGLQVRLVFQIDSDIRLCRCFLRRGGSEIDIGILHAQPPWHLTPHTLRQREQGLRARKAEKLLIPKGADLLQVLWGRWARQAASERSAANKLTKMGGTALPTRSRPPGVKTPVRSRDWISIRLK